MNLERALGVAIDCLIESKAPFDMDAVDGQAAATLRAWLAFVKAAVEHFDGERNYASVIDAYRAAKGEK